MSVKVRVVGLLTSYTAGKAIFDFPCGKTVNEIITSLQIPNNLVAGVFVNDQAQSKEYLTTEGDSVKLIAIIGGG